MVNVRTDFFPILLPKDSKCGKNNRNEKKGVDNRVKAREVMVRNVYKEMHNLGPVFHILLSKTHIFRLNWNPGICTEQKTEVLL